jgi:hypothetical protein
MHEDVWESECIDPRFLTTALVEDEWLASLPGSFTPVPIG